MMNRFDIVGSISGREPSEFGEFVLADEAISKVNEIKAALDDSEKRRREFVASVAAEIDALELRLSKSVVIPEGYAVVPIKPSKAMREACRVAGKLPVWDDMMAAAIKK